MIFRIDPYSWFRDRASRRTDEREKIADYLDGIAAEASNLAKKWEIRISELIVTANAIEELRKVNFRQKLEYNEISPKHYVEAFVNSAESFRIENYYRSVTRVLGSKYNKDADFIVYKLGGILRKRAHTKKQVQEELERIQSAIFFDKSNSEINRISLENCVLVLHQEAAALHTFAKEFRAKK